MLVPKFVYNSSQEVSVHVVNVTWKECLNDFCWSVAVLIELDVSILLTGAGMAEELKKSEVYLGTCAFFCSQYLLAENVTL